MGWGCYKHEWDIESENCQEVMSALMDRKLAEHPLTFGRDNAVCPACWNEIEAERDALRAELATVKAELAEVRSRRSSDDSETLAVLKAGFAGAEERIDKLAKRQTEINQRNADLCAQLEGAQKELTKWKECAMASGPEAVQKLGLIVETQAILELRAKLASETAARERAEKERDESQRYILAAEERRKLTGDALAAEAERDEALSKLAETEARVGELSKALGKLRRHDEASGPCDKPGFKCDCYAVADAALTNTKKTTEGETR